MLYRGLWVSQLSRLLVTLALCPPLALHFLYATYLYFFLPSSPSFPSLLEGATVSLEGVASALNSWHFHGCWLFPLMCVGVWPLWLMAWMLCAQKETADVVTVTPKPHSD